MNNEHNFPMPDVVRFISEGLECKAFVSFDNRGF